MPHIALYAGTFDPITYGHLDVIKRATKLFDRVIIAVAASPSKKPLFSLEERIGLIESVITFSNVHVEGFSGLSVDFAINHQATVLLRGLRTVTDFDYEFQMASMNRQMNPEIESVFLLPAEPYRAISSTLVREVASLNKDVTAFVPEAIAKALKQKFEHP